MNRYEVYIRNGVLINDDPHGRCYDGCFPKSHMEWEPWVYWLAYPSLELAEHAVKQFSRDTQQLKIVEKR